MTERMPIPAPGHTCPLDDRCAEELIPTCAGCQAMAWAFERIEFDRALRGVRTWLANFGDQISEHAHQELASAISDAPSPKEDT